MSACVRAYVRVRACMLKALTSPAEALRDSVSLESFPYQRNMASSSGITPRSHASRLLSSLPVTKHSNPANADLDWGAGSS